MDYRVTWEIDIEEETALGAALVAYRIMLDPEASPPPSLS
jgi:hypothetical protein